MNASRSRGSSIDDHGEFEGRERSLYVFPLIAAFVLLRVWDYWVLMHLSFYFSFGYWYIHPYWASILLLLLVCLLFRNSTGNRVITVTIAVLGVLASLILAKGSDATLVTVAILVSGISIAYLSFTCLRTMLLYSEKTALFSILVGSLVVLVLQICLSSIPPIVATIVASLLPAMVAFFLHKARQGAFSNDSRNIIFRAKDEVYDLLRVALCFGGIVFSYTIVNAFLKNEYGPYAFNSTPVMEIALGGHILSFVLILFLVLMVFRFKRSIGLIFCLRIPALLIVCALVLVAFFGVSPTLQIVTFTATSVFTPIMMAVLIDVGKHSDVPDVTVVSVGLLALYVPVCMGHLLQRVLTIEFSVSLESAQTLLILTLISLLFAFLINPQSKEARYISIETADTKRQTLSDFKTVIDRVRVLGDERNLTDREIEITKLLALGRSKAYIAQELFITENTVRTHSKHIYAKLNINSKNELLKLLDL